MDRRCNRKKKRKHKQIIYKKRITNIWQKQQNKTEEFEEKKTKNIITSSVKSKVSHFSDIHQKIRDDWQKKKEAKPKKNIIEGSDNKFVENKLLLLKLKDCILAENEKKNVKREKNGNVN